jgi:hypothetical protein
LKSPQVVAGVPDATFGRQAGHRKSAEPTPILSNDHAEAFERVPETATMPGLHRGLLN